MRSIGTLFAVGARTTLGGATETAMILRTGLPALRAAPLAAGDDGDAVTMGFDPTLDPFLTGEERAARLAELALAELATAAGTAIGGKRLRAVLALPEPRPDQRRAEAGVLLAQRLRAALSGPFGNPPAELSTQGAAGLAYVLPAALAALAAREVDVLLVGGAHSDYDPETIRALEAGERLFSVSRPDALIPGECAAFALIARDDFGHVHGLSPLLRIYAVSSDTGDLTPYNDTSALDASSLSKVIRDATSALEDELQVGWALGDHGAEHYRTRELYSALVRTHKRWCEPIAIDAPAQRIGHMGAAALPLSLTLAANMVRRGFAPTPFGLLFAGSDGGERGAILVGS